MTGTQKAAMLLMSLDAATATELLKGLDAEDIHEIAMELAHIDVSNKISNNEKTQIAQEFCSSLQQMEARKFSMKAFLNEMLIEGVDKASYLVSTDLRQQIDGKWVDIWGLPSLFTNTHVHGAIPKAPYHVLQMVQRMTGMRYRTL